MLGIGLALCHIAVCTYRLIDYENTIIIMNALLVHSTLTLLMLWLSALTMCLI